jgi:hypothetical protein
MPEWLAGRDDVLNRLAAAVEDAVLRQRESAALTDREDEQDAPVGGSAAVDAADAPGPSKSAAADSDVAPPEGYPVEPEDGGTAADVLGVAAEDHPTGPAVTLTKGPVQPAVAGTGKPQLPGETGFVPWIPDVLGDRTVLDGLPGAASAEQVYQAMIDGTEAEGPIQLDRLVRGVAGSFGLHRVVAARHAAIQAQLPPSLLADPADPDFVWPPKLDPLSWQGFRRTPHGVERPLEHISIREIGNAIVALCGAAAGMTQDQLWAGTLDVFGFTRRNAAQTARLEVALGLLLDAGRVIRRDDGVLIGQVS